MPRWAGKKAILHFKILSHYSRISIPVKPEGYTGMQSKAQRSFMKESFLSFAITEVILTYMSMIRLLYIDV